MPIDLPPPSPGITLYERCFDRLVTNRYEGHEYSNHPDDAGGKTKWGITEAVARAHGYGYDDDMRELPKAKALEIAYVSYWLPLHCNLMPEQIAFEVFEIAYNFGIGSNNVSTAGFVLQRAINVFRDDADVLKEDGIIGVIETIPAMRAVIGRYGETPLLKWINILQALSYYQAAQKNPKLKQFLRGGWTNRIEFPKEIY